MLPVVSIVGRPNVGKSTLYNRLTGTRDALVNDTPGVTRDHIFGISKIGDREVLVVDTGGIGESSDWLSQLVAEQVDSVVADSSSIIMMVDAQQGLTVADQMIADRLGRTNTSVTVAVNKSEGLDDQIACADFQALRFGKPKAISARRGNGVKALLKSVVQNLPELQDPLWQDPGPKVAIIGRPNVGKSTLINTIAQQTRLIVSEVPGTTRDSIVVPVTIGKKRYRLIDTAGVRRRSRVAESLEKLSVVKSLQAIESAHVAVLVLDGSTGFVDQDATLAGLIQRAGRTVVIVINKSDLIAKSNKSKLRLELERKLAFAPHHQALMVSGLHRTGIHTLMRSISKAYNSAMIEMPTAKLNQCLQDAVLTKSPPLAKRRAVKLKYAHQGGRNPPVVVIHGNNVKNLPKHYRRYLENYISREFNLYGTDVRVVLRAQHNPYAKSKKS